MKIHKADFNPAVQEVKDAMHNTKDLRLFKRYQAILMHLKGNTYQEIGDLIGCTVPTVCHYVRDYRNDGLKGLTPGQSPGRPSRLTEEQEQELYQLIVESKPADVGFPAEMNWTSFLIRYWVEQNFRVSYSDRGVRTLLHRLGFSYTKPTYNTLEKADPEKQKAFKEEFETIKKMRNGEIDRILFQDESMIRDYQALSCTWFPKGRQKIVPT